MEIDENGKCIGCGGDPHTGECIEPRPMFPAELDQQRRSEMLDDLDPSIFQVSIYFDITHPVYKQLSKAELTRTTQKLDIVVSAANRLAVAMLKGTIKYPTDNHSINEWLEYALDDAGDAFQYLHLIQEALKVMIPEGMLREPVHLTTDNDEDEDPDGMARLAKAHMDAHPSYEFKDD